jgi:hypothetical protein
MSKNEDTQAARRIVKSIRLVFPEDAAAIDALLLQDGYEVSDFTYPWIDWFSQFTTDAIKKRDFLKAEKHLKLLSHLLEGGNAEITRCIDISYVEPLMWNIYDNELKKEGWKLFPINLRVLYLDMWEEQPFMKGIT